ncbi:hypothetical protein RvY_00536 [Ramazzottius varieornatus]|uniref:Uncharacterized protein n=1 Tax=Ramazzottius varieornatus TaxID=947166 RepID=A0A1D1UGR4_RAMVA|nr:hypothetical protein RvY_00536 [Ramazzottius varieornatus]
MDKPYRPVQEGVSMWSSSSTLPSSPHSSEFRKALWDEAKIANRLRNTASVIKSGLQ